MDYKNSVIYKIVCKDKSITDCYVGSSCSPRSRKCAHKTSCNNENGKSYNLPVYRFIRDNGGWDNWQFVIIEKFSCSNKTELRIRERYWFERSNATLNSYYPERSKKEYYEENKQEILQQKKEHYEKNKQEILQQRKDYREENKEKIAHRKKEYYKENKQEILQQQKEHYEENKQEILQQQKEYREKNKQEIAQKNKEKVECDNCGSVVTKRYLTKHKRTNKCQNHVK